LLNRFRQVPQSVVVAFDRHVLEPRLHPALQLDRLRSRPHPRDLLQRDPFTLRRTALIGRASKQVVGEHAHALDSRSIPIIDRSGRPAGSQRRAGRSSRTRAPRRRRAQFVRRVRDDRRSFRSDTSRVKRGLDLPSIAFSAAGRPTSVALVLARDPV
jgi:hypothetical protein